MKKYKYLFIIFILIISCKYNEHVSSANNPNDKIINLTDSTKWEYIFDGNTFNGWRGFNASKIPHGWIIKNQNLISLPEGQDIMTIEEFENFDLQLKWKLSKGGNSGILYNVTTHTKAKYSYEVGAEYQIIDEENYPIRLNELQKCGSLYAVMPARKDKILYMDKYNLSRIIVKNNHIEHWLNGIKILEYDRYSEIWKKKAKKQLKRYPYYCSSPKGHILLQKYKNSIVYFKEIKIRKLN